MEGPSLLRRWSYFYEGRFVRMEADMMMRTGSSSSSSSVISLSTSSIQEEGDPLDSLALFFLCLDVGKKRKRVKFRGRKHGIDSSFSFVCDCFSSEYSSFCAAKERYDDVSLYGREDDFSSSSSGSDFEVELLEKEEEEDRNVTRRKRDRRDSIMELKSEIEDTIRDLETQISCPPSPSSFVSLPPRSFPPSPSSSLFSSPPSCPTFYQPPYDLSNISYISSQPLQVHAQQVPPLQPHWQGQVPHQKNNTPVLLPESTSDPFGQSPASPLSSPAAATFPSAPVLPSVHGQNETLTYPGQNLPRLTYVPQQVQHPVHQQTYLPNIPNVPNNTPHFESGNPPFQQQHVPPIHVHAPSSPILLHSSQNANSKEAFLRTTDLLRTLVKRLNEVV